MVMYAFIECPLSNLLQSIAEINMRQHWATMTNASSLIPLTDG